MTRPFVLLGGGGHTSDVLSALEAIGVSPTSLIVADDAGPARRFSSRATAHEGTVQTALLLDAQFVVSIGYPAPRRVIADSADSAGATWAAPILHPHASLGVDVELAEGCVVLGQTWLSAGVELERHTHIGYGCTIGHDTRIGAFCSIMPSAAIGGSVQIDEGVLIGANATILQGLRIGPGATIGAGAVVTKDVGPGQTTTGIPARPQT